MRVRAIPFLLFLFVAAVASGDWSVPVPIADDASPGPVAAGILRLASDGESFLLVTSDARGTRARRLDASGRLGDTRGIALGGEIARTPAVAGNGSEWLILDGGGDWMLHADDSIAFVAGLTSRDQQVVSNGRSFLVWSSTDRTAAIVEPFRVVTRVPVEALPRTFDVVASNGDVYAIASLRGNAVDYNVIDATGAVRFAEPRTIELPVTGDRAPRRIALVRVHGNFRVIWSEYAPAPAVEGDIAWAVRSIDFTPAGDVPDAAVTLAEGVGRGRWKDVYNPALSVVQAGAADALVRWSVPGSPLRQTTLGCGAAFDAVAGDVASSGRTTVLLTRERTAVVRAAAFACDPAPLRAALPEIAAWASPQQQHVSIAAGSFGAAAVWIENGRRRARRISADGQPLDLLALPDEAQQPAASFRLVATGASYAAFWSPGDQEGVRFARLGGSAIAPPVVSVLEGWVRYFDVEWTGAHFVLVHTGGDALTVARVGRDGALLDAPRRVLAPPGESYRASLDLARGPSELLAAWVEGGTSLLPCGGCTNPQRLYAFRLGLDGEPLAAPEMIRAYGYEVRSVVWNVDAWYVLIFDRILGHTRIARFGADGPREIALGSSAAAAIFPLGELGVGVVSGDAAFLVLDAAMELQRMPRPPWLADGVRGVALAAAGPRLFAVFTARVAAPPHDGMHRAFVTSMQIARPPRRRPSRSGS